MRLLKATQCRVLLLALLISFTALTLHTSMHTQSDPQGCELCGGHVNPTHAVAAAPQFSIPVASPAIHAWLVPTTHQPEPFAAFRQRGPPVLS